MSPVRFWTYREGDELFRDRLRPPDGSVPLGLFRPCGVSGLADATSIGGVRFLAGAKNPLRTLSRR
jgi:hypothetical protein